MVVETNKADVDVVETKEEAEFDVVETKEKLS